MTAATEGYIEDKNGKKRYLTKEDKKIVEDLANWGGVFYTGVLPADGIKIIEKAFKKVSNRAMTVPQLEMYDELQRHYKGRDGLNDDIKRMAGFGWSKKKIFREIYKKHKVKPKGIKN